MSKLASEFKSFINVPTFKNNQRSSGGTLRQKKTWLTLIWAPISINNHQSASISIIKHQSASISINQHRYYWSNKHQSVPVSINQHQSASISINLHQSAFKSPSPRYLPYIPRSGKNFSSGRNDIDVALILFKRLRVSLVTPIAYTGKKLEKLPDL